MKLRRLIILCSTLFVLPALGRQGGTLPGGLLYPTFATASLTSAAALTSEWGSELVGLYSPPLSSTQPHSALAAFATNARVFGVNVGYTGSLQNQTTFHNVFGGLSYRMGNLSLGFSAKKTDIYRQGNPNYDLSWIYYYKTWRFGMTAFDLLGTRTWGTGIGLGPPDQHTVEIDLTVPMTLDSDVLTSQYAASAAMTMYLGRFGVSFGGRFENYDTSDLRYTTTSLNAGFLMRLTDKWNAVALVNTSPASISVGLAWNNFASPQQVYKHFQALRKKSIQNKGR